MASNPERETPADRSSAEAFQPLYGDGNRIAPTVPPFNQQVIIFPFPVEMERQNTSSPARAEFAGKRKRCDHCGCQCMSSKNGWPGFSSGRGQKLTSPSPRPHCAICKKHHHGECWKAIGGCYRCGDVGHRFRDCPKNSRKNGKLARAQAEDAENSVAQEASSRVPAPVIPVP